MCNVSAVFDPAPTDPFSNVTSSSSSSQSPDTSIITSPDVSFFSDQSGSQEALFTDNVSLPAAVHFMDESADMLHLSDDGKLPLLVGNLLTVNIVFLNSFWSKQQ